MLLKSPNLICKCKQMVKSSNLRCKCKIAVFLNYNLNAKWGAIFPNVSKSKNSELKFQNMNL